MELKCLSKNAETYPFSGVLPITFPYNLSQFVFGFLLFVAKNILPDTIEHIKMKKNENDVNTWDVIFSSLHHDYNE